MDDLENIFSNLKLNAGDSFDGEDAEKYLKEIEVALEKNETPSKWIDELGKDYGPVTKEELNKVHVKIEKDFSSSLEGDASGDALRYSVVEIIAKKCLKVEIKIQRDECQAASIEAMAIVKFINEHKAYYAEKEYMVGFRYVANCLAIKGQLQDIRNKNETKDVNVSRLKDLLAALNKCQLFSTQHQVGVLALKQYFAGYLRKGNCHDFQLRIVRRLVALDPENLEWRFCLYSMLRFKRAATKNFGAPAQEEIDVINEAYGKRYAIFDARICLGYAFCLAELLKSSGKMFTPIRYGSKVFHREAEVLDCIRAKVDDVLAIDPTSVRSNIDVAKIYSSILPYSHRDTAFALVCIKRALLFHPNSSKANHRMAVLLTSTNSSSEAVEYLQKAVANDEGNIFAMLDLLKAYMADIPTYEMEMKQIFSDPVHKAGKYYSDILVLRAVYSHLNGNSEKSVNLLIKAVTNDAKCIDSLERMHNNFKRCDWGDYNSFSKRIKGILAHRMSLCGGAEKEIIFKIWKSLKDGNEYGNHFRSGRGSYQSGGYSYDSGYKGRHSGGSRPGGSYHESGYENKSGGGGSYHESGYKNKSGGSQSEISRPKLDDYAVLGLSQSATLADIKKNFFKLAKEHHPDKNMHLSERELLEKQELMKRINSAYGNLVSAIKK